MDPVRPDSDKYPNFQSRFRFPPSPVLIVRVFLVLWRFSSRIFESAHLHVISPKLADPCLLSFLHSDGFAISRCVLKRLLREAERSQRLRHSIRMLPHTLRYVHFDHCSSRDCLRSSTVCPLTLSTLVSAVSNWMLQADQVIAQYLALRATEGGSRSATVDFIIGVDSEKLFDKVIAVSFWTRPGLPRNRPFDRNRYRAKNGKKGVAIGVACP